MKFKTLDKSGAGPLLSKNLPLKLLAMSVLTLSVSANAMAKNKNDILNNSVLTVQQAGQQTEPVTGVVTDDKGRPLPGVTVQVKGTTTGYISDIDGKYSVVIPNRNAVLVFTMVGFKTQEKPVGAARAISITLVESSSELDEIVVVGYGVQKKATLAGSVATVRGKEIAKNPSANLTANLAGKLPGLIVNQRSGEPGRDDPTIFIRGQGTLNDSGPLVVIDGVPGRGGLSRLNPEDIESFSVLKDASAAIYGNRAANGVILVTTKTGTKGKPVFGLTYNYAFNSPTKIPKMLDAATFATVYNEGASYRGSAAQYTPDAIQKYRDGSDPVLYPNTDWVGQVLKPYSYQQRINLTVNGGSENSRYLISFGSLSQDGNFKYDPTFNRQYNIRTKLDVDVSKYFSIGVNINAIPSKRTYSPAGTGVNFINLLQSNPTLIARYPNGLIAPGRFTENPLLLDQRGTDRTEGFPLTSTFTASFKLPWIDGVRLDASYNYDLNNEFQKRFNLPYFYHEYNVNTQQYDRKPGTATGVTELQDTYRKTTTALYNLRLSYDKTIKQHHFNVMVGSEQQTNNFKSAFAYRKNFLSNAIDQIDLGSPASADLRNGGNETNSAYNNYFGRLNYEFASKYILDFVFRYDGSQIFPPGKRYAFFPGVSAAWRLSEESFFKGKLPFVDQLKLRATYGELGNDRVGAYQYSQFYGFGGNYVFGTNDVQGLTTGTLPNPNVTWEVSKKTDLGLEAQLWNGLLGVDFTLFHQKRSNILLQRNFSAPKVFGFPTLPPENIGEMSNKGFELTLSHRNRVGALQYTVRGDLSYQTSKVVFQDETPRQYAYQNATGRPFGSQLIYVADGIFHTQAELNNYPHQNGQKLGDIKVIDQNGDGKIDANDQIRFDYNTVPKYVYGLNIDLQYKNFDLNIFFQGQQGAYNYDASFASLGNTDFSNASIYRAADRWSPSNPNGTMPRADAFQPGNTTFFMNHSAFVRLKSLELGYSLPKDVISKIKVNNLRLFVSGFNLITWSKIKWSDPEVSGNFTSYPPQRIINLGANVRF